MVEKIIEREGKLLKGLNDAGKEPLWVPQFGNPIYINMDVAEAAIELGYKVGDRFKYKIVIESKK